MERWVGRLKHSLAVPGHRSRPAFRAKVAEFKASGLVPNERTMTSLMGNTTSLEQMQFLEDALGFKANKLAWSILLKNALDKRWVSIALSFYDAAKESGIRPDSIMIHPILRALCNVVRPTPAMLDKALILYRDLCNVTINHM